MSTYFQINGAALSVCPDPDGYQDRGIAVVGKFVNGGVIRQGRGGGTYRWRVLTQAEYGMLKPREQVSWNEFWYPVHGLGDGFEYATLDVAIQAKREGNQLAVRVISTARFPNATCRLIRADQLIAESKMDLSPAAARVLEANVAPGTPVTITLTPGIFR